MKRSVYNHQTSDSFPPSIRPATAEQARRGAVAQQEHYKSKPGCHVIGPAGAPLQLILLQAAVDSYLSYQFCQQGCQPEPEAGLVCCVSYRI